MSEIPVLPLFLQPEQLKHLNDHLVEKTGCFAFLKTDKVLFATEPKSWQDAYTIFGIGLYAVYHDFGCRFLKNLILNDSLCPGTLPKPGRYRLHINTLCQHIRANLAHGLLLSSQRVELQRQLASYYLNSHADYSVWPVFINRLNEADWTKITRLLVQDADSLYNYLWKWGEEWAKTPDQLTALQKKFVHFGDNFVKSFDCRICKAILIEQGIDYRHVEIYIGNKSSYIKNWQEKLMDAYSAGIHSPEALYQKLVEWICDDLRPPRESSADIAARFGFGFNPKSFGMS